VKEVNARNEEVVITKNGTPPAILMSHDKFESVEKTIAIRSDAEIRKVLRDRKQKHTRLYTLEELFR
jgi:prevent-host-death family protein